MIDKIDKKLVLHTEHLLRKTDLTCEDVEFLLHMKNHFMEKQKQHEQQLSNEKWKEHMSNMIKMFAEDN
jgi:hypothetical protein